MLEHTCQTCGVQYFRDWDTVALSNKFPNNYHLKYMLTYCDVCRKKVQDAVFERAIKHLPDIVKILSTE